MSFRSLCTDLQYGPSSDPIAFNDLELFYKHIVELQDKVSVSDIRHNIEFRSHIERLAQTFDRKFVFTTRFYVCNIWIID